MTDTNAEAANSDPSLPVAVTAPFSQAQRSQLLTLVRRVGKAEIMPHFRNLDPSQIGTKSGPQDIVTHADRAAEAMLTRGLLSMFPNALIVGEETITDAVLDKIADAELAFTIDPIDGTWNFARGLATFGTMISVLRFGIPVFGLLYDPIMGDAILADTNTPSEFLSPRRVRHRVSTRQGGASLDTLTGQVPLAMLPAEHRPAAASLMPAFERVTSLRCTCHEFRLLAQGHIDFVLSARLTPWDHAPGVITTQQAGGHVAMLDGRDFRAHHRDGYLLSACDEETWNRVRDAFAFLITDPD
ncbi:inositol monophosphatase [Cognatishimia sp. F0-27]|uniref:inositol monophosphatase family protein n=1 Tax=Cognatishimia sp. F0-27 TaxID=2816855 RepID=UPI001D0C5D47|nr:inositol monophosphatase [Cognatishimia sp. F0-27]MCC1493782.1 inositol monophosphatase [Cognatishimia sp. F0-27]